MVNKNFGISGKARSGKNTIASLIQNEIHHINYDVIAFADPIKRMIEQAYPNLPKEWLYGPSDLRDNLVPNCFNKDGSQSSVRDLLINLGNDFGRDKNKNIWLDAFHYNFNKSISNNCSVIVPDIRFINEFKLLKNEKFITIRVFREDSKKIKDISENQQDGISDSEFDFVIHNNSTIEELKNIVSKIVKKSYVHQ